MKWLIGIGLMMSLLLSANAERSLQKQDQEENTPQGYIITEDQIIFFDYIIIVEDQIVLRSYVVIEDDLVLQSIIIEDNVIGRTESIIIEDNVIGRTKRLNSGTPRHEDHFGHKVQL